MIIATGSAARMMRQIMHSTVVQGEERGNRRKGGRRREIIFMPRPHPLVGVTFNLDPWFLPGTNIWTLSEKFVPTIGQPHKANQCMPAVLKALRLNQRTSKMLVTFAHNWIAEMAERNAAKHACDRQQR